MKMNWRMLSLLMCLFGHTYTAYAEDVIASILKRGTLKVGLEAGYMPFEMRDKKGEIIGFDVDLAQMIAKEMNVKLEIVNTEWDGIIPSLLTSKFDMIISGMTATPERNLKVNYSDPYIVVGQTILVKKGLGVKSYRELNDSKYTVASKLGTTGEQAVKKYLGKANYKSYQAEQEGSLEVVAGKVDAFVYDHPYNTIFANGKGKDKVDFMAEPFTHEPLAIAVRRGDVDILNWLNHFISLIKKDGRYEAMYDKWFLNTEWLDRVQ